MRGVLYELKSQVEIHRDKTYISEICVLCVGKFKAEVVSEQQYILVECLFLKFVMGGWGCNGVGRVCRWGCCRPVLGRAPHPPPDTPVGLFLRLPTLGGRPVGGTKHSPCIHQPVTEAFPSLPSTEFMWR